MDLFSKHTKVIFLYPQLISFSPVSIALNPINDIQTQTDDKPRTIVSMQDKLGFLFEAPMKEFASDSKPTEYDVVCRWIFEFDKVRGSKRFMKRNEKSQVIQTVTNDVISVWKLQSFETLNKVEVKKRVRTVIGHAEEYIQNGAYTNHKNDKPWIESEQKSFWRTFNISIDSVTPRISGKKRKTEEEMVSVINDVDFNEDECLIQPDNPTNDTQTKTIEIGIILLID